MGSPRRCRASRAPTGTPSRQAAQEQLAAARANGAGPGPTHDAGAARKDARSSWCDESMTLGRLIDDVLKKKLGMNALRLTPQRRPLRAGRRQGDEEIEIYAKLQIQLAEHPVASSTTPCSTCRTSPRSSNSTIVMLSRG